MRREVSYKQVKTESLKKGKNSKALYLSQNFTAKLLRYPPKATVLGNGATIPGSHRYKGIWMRSLRDTVGRLLLCGTPKIWPKNGGHGSPYCARQRVSDYWTALSQISLHRSCDSYNSFQVTPVTGGALLWLMVTDLPCFSSALQKLNLISVRSNGSGL